MTADVRSVCNASDVANVLSVFRDLHTAYALKGDVWRARAFRHAQDAFVNGCLTSRGHLSLSLSSPPPPSVHVAHEKDKNNEKGKKKGKKDGQKGKNLNDESTPLETVPGIGKGIVHVVRLVLEQGPQKALEEILSSPSPSPSPRGEMNDSPPSVVTAKTLAAYKSFIGVLGIGEKKARDLVRAGYTSVEQLGSPVLRAKCGIDTPLVKVGLRYREDLLRRVPRRAATSIIRRLKSVLAGMATNTGKGGNMIRVHDLVPMGSYRRGADSVGDIDLLLTDVHRIPVQTQQTQECRDHLSGKKGERGEKGETTTLESFGHACRETLGEDFVFLISQGPKRLSFLMQYDHYNQAANGKRKTGTGRKSVCQIDVFRMKDPAEEASFLLYGTGSALFNEGMRHFAKTKGFKLNEYGLFDLARNRPVSHVRCEADIFETLGVPYVPPEKRTHFEST